MDNTKYLENIFKDLKATIKYDVNAENDRPQHKYLDIALENLKLSYKTANRLSRFTPWSFESTKEVTKIWLEIQPEVLSAIEKFLQEFKHKKLTKEIQATTARAAIKAAMQEAGLKHHFTGQTHRAKVSVLITDNKALTFYLTYRKVHEQLPQIIESLKCIRQELEFFGKNFSINKAYHISEFK